jgi:predicted nucleotidyltransferase
MLSKTDKKVIIALARKYGVGELFLFGSGCEPKKPSRDIDLGVSGIAAKKFFSFYGDLMFSLSLPVDLVNLSKDNKFNRLIFKNGLRLYGKAL